MDIGNCFSISINVYNAIQYNFIELGRRNSLLERLRVTDAGLSISINMNQFRSLFTVVDSWCTSIDIGKSFIDIDKRFTDIAKSIIDIDKCTLFIDINNSIYRYRYFIYRYRQIN